MIFQSLEVKLPTLQWKYHNLKTFCPWSCPIYPTGSIPVLSVGLINECLVILYLPHSVHSFEVCCFYFILDKRHMHWSFSVFQNSNKTATTLLQRPLYLALSKSCYIKLNSNKNRVGETNTGITFTFYRQRVLYQFWHTFEVCSEWEHIKEYSRNPYYEMSTIWFFSLCEVWVNDSGFLCQFSVSRSMPSHKKSQQS